ncbi:MAG: hypothetical protein J5807_02815 [Kiritimatiellae bacterium]|nr:hypothetical protein [Kiritimatiellia bacterium]
MANIDPDTLLKKVDKKGMSGDLVLSIVLHALVIGLTSFGLYASWMKWGVHSPSQIKVLEKAAAKEAAKAAAEAKAKADAEAAATNSVEKAEAKKPAAEAEKKQDKKDAAKKDAAPEALPLDKQVEAPPKNFDLNEIDL